MKGTFSGYEIPNERLSFEIPVSLLRVLDLSPMGQMPLKEPFSIDKGLAIWFPNQHHTSVISITPSILRGGDYRK